MIPADELRLKDDLNENLSQLSALLWHCTATSARAFDDLDAHHRDALLSLAARTANRCREIAALL